MRYFEIYIDNRNPLPRCLNWGSLIKPGYRRAQQVYPVLRKNNYLDVELNAECEFMDILCNPCFMVSKEFADLIRLFSPNMKFKNIYLFDSVNQRTAVYLVPDLPEIDCLHEDSELSRNKSEIINGILLGEKIQNLSIFRLGTIETDYIIANLEFVESAYRREIKGMKIKEFRVL